MESRISSDIYAEYLKVLLSGEHRQCSMIVESLLNSGVDIKDLYLNLFQRSMYRVGKLWETNKISVAIEHLATSITLQLLNQIYPRLFNQKKVNKTAVIACIADEYHQLGSQIVSDIFEINGWNGYYLGSNTPVADLISTIEQKKPDILGLSLTLYFNMKNLWNAVEIIRNKFPELFILVGGQAFLWGGKEITQSFTNVHYASDIVELENIIKMKAS